MKTKLSQIFASRLVHPIIFLLFVGLSIILLRSLILSPGLIYWFDFAPPFDEYSISQVLHQVSYTWNPNMAGGWVWSGTSALQYILAMVLPQSLFGVEAGIEVLLVIIFSLAGFGAYYAIHRLGVKRFPAFCGGLLYMLNPWIMSHFLLGHVNMMIGYIFIPLAFSFSASALSQRSFRYILAASFFAFLSFTDMRNIALFAILLSGYALFKLLLFIFREKGIHKENLPALATCLGVPFAILVISLAFSAFWLLPAQFVISSMNPYYPPVSHLYILSQYNSISDAFMPSYQEYLYQVVQGFPGDPTLYYIWRGLGLLFSAFLFCTVLFKRNKFTIFFSFTALAGIFLVKGTDPPLGNLYLFFYEHVPFATMFRNPTHFSPLIYLSFSFLLASLIDVGMAKTPSLSRFRPSKLRWRALKLGKVCLSVIPCILLVSQVMPIYAVPDLTTVELHPGEYMQTIELPDEYLSLQDFLREQGGESRTASFPPGHGGLYPWSNACIYFPEYSYPPKPTINPFEAADEDTQTNRMTWWSYEQFYRHRTMYPTWLFGILGVEWFVLRTDAQVSFPGSHVLRAPRLGYATDTEALRLIQDQPELDLIYHQGPNYVYQSNDVLPPVAASNSLVLAVGDRRILSSLSYSDIPFSWLEEHPLIFLDSIDYHTLKEILPLSSYVILQGNRFDDLAFKAVDERYLLQPVLHLSNTDDSSGNWIYGAWLLGGWDGDTDAEIKSFAFTMGLEEPRLEVPFTADENGKYELWINAFTGQGLGTISVTVDEDTVFSAELAMDPYMQSNLPGAAGFYWTKLGDLSLERGEHVVILGSEGINCVSRIALIPSETLDAARVEVVELLSKYDVIPISIIEAEQMMPGGDTSVKSLRTSSDGRAITSPTTGEGEGWYGKLRAETNFYIPRDSTYIIKLRMSPNYSFIESKVNVDGDYFVTWFQDYALEKVPADERANAFKNLFIGPIALKQGVHRLEFHDFVMPYLDQILIYPYVEEPHSYEWREDFSALTKWQFLSVDIKGGEDEEEPYDYFSRDGMLHIWMDTSTAAEHTQYVALKCDLEQVIDTSTTPYFEARLKTSPNAYLVRFYFLDTEGELIGHLGANLGNMTTITWNISEAFGNRKIASLYVQFSYYPPTHTHAGLDRETVSTEIDYIGFSNEVDKKPTYLLNDKGMPADMVYERKSPTSATVALEADSPFLLVFLETYNPGWQAVVDGQELEPIVAWSYANAFLVEPQADIPIVLDLEYTPQKYFYYGSLISTLTVLGSIGALIGIIIWEWRKSKKRG